MTTRFHTRRFFQLWILVLTLLPVLLVGSAHADTVRRFVFSTTGGRLVAADQVMRIAVGQPCAGDRSAGGLSLEVGYATLGFGSAGPIVTAVDTPRPSGGKLELPTNVPNPFNPSTVFHYVIPSGAGRVSLRVFDLRGRLVTVLVDDELPAGPGSVTWRGVDDAGGSVASGVYFALLEAGDQKVSRRVTLVK